MNPPAMPTPPATPSPRAARWLRALRRGLLPALLAVVCLARGGPATVPDDFATGNRLYAEGKFPAAAAAYQRLLQTGVVSANLLFNYGSAACKAGRLGDAIAAFRRAALLDPRDPEIRANLDYARSQAPGASIPGPRWQDWAGQLTLNEWTGLTALAFWLACLLLAARQLRPALAPRLKRWTSLALLLTLLFGTGTGLQAAGHFTRAVAVVTVPAATARSGPFDDAQAAFATRDGAELRVLSRHEGWAQVTDASGRTGWLNPAQIEVVPGA